MSEIDVESRDAEDVNNLSRGEIKLHAKLIVLSPDAVHVYSPFILLS